MPKNHPSSGDRTLFIANSDAMEALGAALAATLITTGGIVALAGELGAGKTTLVRGMLRGLGHRGIVRSPTYTLLEEYQIDQRQVLHLDLYRLADAQELEYLGLRDALAENPLVLVEWPERGAGVLPPWDLEIAIAYQGQARQVSLHPASETGIKALAGINLSGSVNTAPDQTSS